MLQKENNIYSIIESIRLQSKHLRRISKELDLIPSTVMRLLNQLEKENVVDYKKEGKNKIFF
jgi:Mn-dependent DtxR family transcriptional regulator